MANGTTVETVDGTFKGTVVANNGEQVLVDTVERGPVRFNINDVKEA